MSAFGRSETTDDLLAALLDGMDAALCAFDADGVITHWNREAERILGWTPAEAVGRKGFAGWAVRAADAQDVEERLMAAQDVPGRQVHEFALLTKEGGRVLVRTQSAGVPGADGKPAGVYCAFSEVHAQIDLERSIALSEALMDDASWGVVLVDVDLRPAVVNAHAARAFGSGRTALLGRPLGELLVQGVEELEGALQHVLADGSPPAPVELWVSVRTPEGVRRRCWRSGFLRLGSPLAEEPVPLGVGWLFQDITEARQASLDTAQLRFRSSQLHRSGRAAAECEDPAEAAAVRLDFALAGFAEHALLDVLEQSADPDRQRLVRVAASPPVLPGAGAGQARYEPGHPALQALDRIGSVRTSAPRGEAAAGWARDRQWPEDAAHVLCTVLRSRGRTLGALTFVRGASRAAFEQADAAYAEEVAARVAADLDLAAWPRTPDGGLRDSP
ncbi:PAS domain-containing protein [Streptomyces sp. NBC_01443]|uniref:PAS domain-containing protein n=1 Tax=Streptomyces sp. NBC_01443 TaxID=2903868 RepID=UPI00224EDBAA|nr:PAS domain-containing protein [Streptomyces sp. NBC_01443]MCX4629246.1 PAS domain-containing protein [Streptomyces sp. NBC_01443]